MIKDKKILYISPRYFFPANDWAKIVFYNTVKELSKYNEIDYLTNVSKEDFSYNFKEAKNLVNEFSYDLRDVSKQNFWYLFLSFLKKDSYFFRKYHTKKMKNMISEMMGKNKYDIVWLESAFMTTFSKFIKDIDPNVKIVSRSHNVEHLLLKRIASEEKNIFKKYLIKRESIFWENLEFEYLDFIDYFFTISESDRTFFLNKMPSLLEKTQVLLPWVDFEKYQFTHLTTEKNLVFIGMMDYFPNIQAVKWFKEKVFDEIWIFDKEIKFYIVWKNASSEIKKMASDRIIVENWKNKDLEYFNKARIFIVPLLSWSWIKLKVLNALAMGKPILSTKIGLEWISLHHGENVFCSDDPEVWKSLILQNIWKSETLENIAENGRQFIEENFSWEKNISKIRL